MRLVVGAIALAAVIIAQRAPAFAQPLPDPPPEKSSSGSTTKIPVTMPGNTEVLGAEASAVSAPPAPVSLEQPIDPNTYICGPGDVFDLNFWGQQNFRLRIAADLEGRAFISKVGFVSVAGKTLTKVRDEVNRKVRGDYPGLKFELTLVAPRTFLVHVVENVKKPGSYTAYPLDRVSTLLDRAGGTFETSSRRRVTIRHRHGGDSTADLLMYELTGNTTFNPYVLDGDIITVPFAELTVSVAGAVRRPGNYELVSTKDLTELLEVSGGLSSAVARTLPLRIVRKDARDHETFIDVPYVGAVPRNELLRDLDRVEVRGIDELQRSVLVVGAVVGAEGVDTATTAKRLPYVAGDTVLSLINRAGGIRAPGDLHRSYISRPQKSGPPKIISVDLEALLIRRDFSADKPVEMNDTITVPPKQYSVLVEGAVVRAGMYPFNPQFGVPEYIAHAGGRTRTAKDLEDVKLIDWNGKTHDFRADMPLSPGDAILVPERNFTRAEMVQLVIAGAGLILSGVAITLAATQ